MSNRNYNTTAKNNLTITTSTGSVTVFPGTLHGDMVGLSIRNTNVQGIEISVNLDEKQRLSLSYALSNGKQSQPKKKKFRIIHPECCCDICAHKAGSNRCKLAYRDDYDCFKPIPLAEVIND